MRKIALCIIALLAPLAPMALMPATAAHADTGHLASIEVKEVANGTVRYERSHWVETRELAYFEPSLHGFAYVEFNDGSAWAFAPCVYEDSPRCYWDAGNRGNHVGSSFIRFKGKTFRL